LDLLGRGPSSAIGEVEATISSICEIQNEDGIVFDSESVEGTRIKEDDTYDGVRIKLLAELAGARITMQIDIAFGDAVYPEPELASFPVLLPLEAPLIVPIRENRPSLRNSMRCRARYSQQPHEDFYDVWLMANTWTFEMASLRSAIFASFERRGSPIPETIPFSLTEAFLNDPTEEPPMERIREPPESRRQSPIS